MPDLEQFRHWRDPKCTKIKAFENILHVIDLLDHDNKISRELNSEVLDLSHLEFSLKV